MPRRMHADMVMLALQDNSTVCLSHKPLYFKRWDDSYNGTTLQALVEQTGVFTSGAFTHKCMYWSAAHAHLFQVLNFPDDPDIGASQTDRPQRAQRRRVGRILRHRG
mmetsp:Transcript_37137/g.93854  ORF Transcript_37137/g.93854 Transcript_37137/m.93854 type:complete len:107 (-) Transcript_37137:311-631(-)